MFIPDHETGLLDYGSGTKGISVIVSFFLTEFVRRDIIGESDRKQN